MRKIELIELERIEGGGFFSGFCRGVQASTDLYGAGVLGNLWNPPGAAAGVALLVVNGACVFA